MLVCLLFMLFVNFAVDGKTLWSHKEFDRHDYTSGWHAAHLYDHEAGSVVHDPAGGSNYVLRVFYKKGHYASHGPSSKVQFFATPVSHRDTMTLSYDVYFDKDFDFRRGGKLPGLYGGWTNCSGGRHDDNCFSTRFMWRADGDGEVYGYIQPSDHQVSSFCDHNVCNSVKGYSLGRGKWRFQRGKWQNIAQTVHLNTAGKQDGYIKVYYNGKQVYEIDHLAIRGKSSVHIDGIFFSTFFGGSTSDWAPTHDCYSYFKNFVLSDDTSHATILG